MKKAFTLAETLITLGIIGVVAALTISVIVGKFQKYTLKVEIKKNYSMLSQIQQKLIFDYADGLTLKDGFGWADYNKAVIDNLKVIKTCKKNALRDKCIPEYQGLNISACSAFNENNIYNNATVYVLADGSIIIPYNADWRSLWLVDVNGLKGPNKASYDLFQVTLDTLSYIEYLGRGCINQDSSIKGGLKDFKDIDNW